MNTIAEVDPDIITGPWRIREGAHYKNKRDFMQPPKWVLIYWTDPEGGLDGKILHSAQVNGPVATIHNVYETDARIKCVRKAFELGIDLEA